MDPRVGSVVGSFNDSAHIKDDDGPESGQLFGFISFLLI